MRVTHASLTRPARPTSRLSAAYTAGPCAPKPLASGSPTARAFVHTNSWTRGLNLGLAGKTILVTGGGAGIGGAISLALAQEGAIPAILGRSPLNPAFAAELHAAQPDAIFVQVDLTDDAACAAAVEQIAAEGRGIHGLVNNAGTNDNVGLERSTADFLQSVTNNLGHYFGMVRHCLPHLRETKGAIVNISSKTAVTGQGGTSGYVAAKAAQLGLTREWAAALVGDGIRVNAVVPAEVMTPLYANWLATLPNPDATLARITGQIPLEHRMTTAEEIASATVFLLSPTQSGHTTGQHLVVDGGYVHLDRMLTAGPLHGE